MKTPKINVKYLNQCFTLTQRGMECLILTSLGYPKKHIASRLGISYRTAEKHIANAKNKIGVHHQHQLIDFVFSSQMSVKQPTTATHKKFSIS
ncbi:helix-turn-helix transcriptional regulator [Candidatus Tisiphia endosymbiont of Nemotelus uliginosus]|uniref:helix-turn-helix transcriptional regulator n=1 Tax=Candidatus Tisiphia endosymbiont of Nemotelus uliginosus TaxID=3077926 RepID=UPI0035C8D564